MNFEKLTEAGVDIESLTKRLMGNTALIKIFIKKFTEDKTFENLIFALNSDDMRGAELSSHTLKGMCGNLSLTELYVLFTEQVNLIRAEKYSAAKDMMNEISTAFEKTVKIMNDWLGELK